MRDSHFEPDAPTDARSVAIREFARLEKIWDAQRSFVQSVKFYWNNAMDRRGSLAHVDYLAIRKLASATLCDQSFNMSVQDRTSSLRENVFDVFSVTPNTLHDLPGLNVETGEEYRNHVICLRSNRFSVRPEGIAFSTNTLPVIVEMHAATRFAQRLSPYKICLDPYMQIARSLTPYVGFLCLAAHVFPRVGECHFAVPVDDAGAVFGTTETIDSHTNVSFTAKTLLFRPNHRNYTTVTSEQHPLLEMRRGHLTARIRTFIDQHSIAPAKRDLIAMTQDFCWTHRETLSSLALSVAGTNGDVKVPNINQASISLAKLVRSDAWKKSLTGRETIELAKIYRVPKVRIHQETNGDGGPQGP
jgi:hypothetical protein